MIQGRFIDGKWRYRYWSDNTNSYYTPEMTEKQMVRWFIDYNIERSLSHTGIGLDRMFEEARNDDALGAGWDKIRKEWRPDKPKKSAKPHLPNKKGEVYYIRGDARNTPAIVDGKAMKVTVTVELVDIEEARKGLEKR